MNPLLPLWSLTTHVEQLEVKASKSEVHLDDTSCLDASTKNVLLGRLVVGLTQPIQVIEKAGRNEYSNKIEFNQFISNHNQYKSFTFQKVN